MRKVQIKCSGSGVLEFGKIKDFQGNLKRRSEGHLQQIITSIDKYGFSFPFFIWKNGGQNWCLDGHGRLAALAKMKADGWSIPPLPVAYVQAKDRNEAKQKLLRMNSSYGEIDVAGLQEFIDGLEIEITELALPVQIPADIEFEIPDGNKDIDEAEMADTQNECPKCGFCW